MCLTIMSNFLVLKIIFLAFAVSFSSSQISFCCTLVFSEMFSSSNTRSKTCPLLCVSHSALQAPQLDPSLHHCGPGHAQRLSTSSVYPGWHQLIEHKFEFSLVTGRITTRELFILNTTEEGSGVREMLTCLTQN